MADRLVFIDCEMTGLDPASDALIEVAALVTDGDLNVLGDGVNVVIKPDEQALARMGDFVREMHVASGLLDDLPTGVTMTQAQEQVLDYVRTHVSEPKKAPLAGNTVSTDRLFLARDMPDLESYLHYRIVDVSSVKELVRRWYPRVYFAAPAKTGNHRALGDIRDSIDELRYYRQAVFVPLPGPDTDTARAIAASVRPDANQEAAAHVRAHDGAAEDQAAPVTSAGPDAASGDRPSPPDRRSDRRGGMPYTCSSRTT